MTSFAKADHTLTWLRVGDLTVSWPEAQRALAEYKAEEIVRAFDPDVFGTLTVSKLPDGKYHVSDGWTRASAIRTMFGDNERVPCVVVPAASAARAAQIFTMINGGRTKPSAMDMFKVGVTAGNAPECAVDDIVADMGLAVDMSQAEGTIRACAALLSIYKQYGGDGLRDTLMMILDTWGRDSAGFDAHLMRGFALFLAQTPGVRADRLAKKIARKFTPGRLVGAAKATREAFGGSMPRAVCALMQEVYAPGGRVPATVRTEAA
jgi:Family of unknown function (DUF6551)